MEPNNQNNKLQIPPLDEIIKNNPPVQVDNIEYENEDEEEINLLNTILKMLNSDVDADVKSGLCACQHPNLSEEIKRELHSKVKSMIFQENIYEFWDEYLEACKCTFVPTCI